MVVGGWRAMARCGGRSGARGASEGDQRAVASKYRKRRDQLTINEKRERSWERTEMAWRRQRENEGLGGENGRREREETVL